MRDRSGAASIRGTAVASADAGHLHSAALQMNEEQHMKCDQSPQREHFHGALVHDSTESNAEL